MTKEYTKFQVGQKESNGSAGLEEQRSLRDSREEAAMQQPLQMGQGLYRQTCSEDTQDKSKDAEGPRLGVSREVGKKVCTCECGPRCWCPGRSPAQSTGHGQAEECRGLGVLKLEVAWGGGLPETLRLTPALRELPV